MRNKIKDMSGLVKAFNKDKLELRQIELNFN